MQSSLRFVKSSVGVLLFFTIHAWIVFSRSSLLRATTPEVVLMSSEERREGRSAENSSTDSEIISPQPRLSKVLANNSLADLSPTHETIVNHTNEASRGSGEASITQAPYDYSDLPGVEALNTSASFYSEMWNASMHSEMNINLQDFRPVKHKAENRAAGIVSTFTEAAVLCGHVCFVALICLDRKSMPTVLWFDRSNQCSQRLRPSAASTPKQKIAHRLTQARQRTDIRHPSWRPRTARRRCLGRPLPA